ncbi:helix-turn-helix domain-containing protein [Anaerocolumna chitinilytica]|uniref:HTH cro/C1-type domain-containing protein n=1 Tax=Anaerocolumna chitinilytica TaxID=1727145 RepID=A0A7I8DSP3_9FIRM|nr:helix-turn-helix transcriptional regulator [Anaerocolumna chitinilytica]BCK00738.1 hypothetical protein bsdcttw_37780 [Anaerocolumna chitinilytica]
MNNLGDILVYLRKLKQVTQSEVAEALGMTVRSISRYETNKSGPNFAILKSLMEYYGFGTLSLFESTTQDILSLKHGLLGTFEAELLNDYNRCQNNKPLPGYDYFWINKYGNLIGGQTRFVDFCSDDRNKEIRTLRLVPPIESIKRCESIYKKKPVVINKRMDVLIFELFGGEAIVRTDICNEYMSEYMVDFISENKDNIFQ